MQTTTVYTSRAFADSVELCAAHDTRKNRLIYHCEEARTTKSAQGSARCAVCKRSRNRPGNYMVTEAPGTYGFRGRIYYRGLPFAEAASRCGSIAGSVVREDVEDYWYDRYDLPAPSMEFASALSSHTVVWQAAHYRGVAQ